MSCNVPIISATRKTLAAATLIHAANTRSTSWVTAETVASNEPGRALIDIKSRHNMTFIKPIEQVLLILAL